MPRVQFGLILPENPENPPDRSRYLTDVNHLLTYVADHYQSAWMVDHLQGDVLEGWTTLTYLAALHPRLHWGHTVLSQPFRNPALLAKMAATLQFLTVGRFILGIGAGGQASEHHAYGFDFPPGHVRVAALDEALQIVKALWTHERATFAGQHHRIQDARCEPRPTPIPPIVVGAFRPQMLRLVARHADWWNVSSTGLETYRAYRDQLDRACHEIGRDPATVRRVWSGGCICAPTDAEIVSLAAGRLRRGPRYAYQPGEDFLGTPAQLVEQLQPFVELGVDYFLLDCGGFPRRTTVEHLIHDVLPALNR